jgi:anti-sigma factor (TIGR02949 family)
MPDEIPMIDCRTAVRRLWDYLDDELDDARMLEVRQHLQVCADCLPHAEFGRRFLDALHSARERNVVPFAARAQILAALAEAGYTPP